MARNEKRGKRERAQRQRDTLKPVGPDRDFEDELPNENEVRKHRPDREWVRKNRRDEEEE